jgi:hypothetical protein
MDRIIARHRTSSKRRTKLSNFDKQVNDLLRQAMERPGVAEAMKVFQAQQPALGAYARAQSAVSPRWIISTSNSTAKQQS